MTALDASDISKLRFLVVEDHGFQRWIVGNLLEGLGAKNILLAPGGQSALEIFRNFDEPIDIIVSDLDMPGMDGMQFIRHLGESGTAVSLIVASSMDRSLIASVGIMAKEYGVTLLGAIQKPVTANKLRSLIELHPAAKLAGSRPAMPAPEQFTVEQVISGIQREEFEPFFQAKVEMEGRRIHGAEALARWRHPVKGIIGPHSFVGVLEKAGQIELLTNAILKKAAFACAYWQNAGYDVQLSINLSLDSLGDVLLAERMLNAVVSQGLDPRKVTFEVTESAMAANMGNALENVSRLRMKGFGLSIDDYGTGYSSMQQLTKFPFTELKIDRAFVKGAATDASCRAVLESSLEIAKKMKIAAVAEGVETKAQWDLLLELGCQMAQGYFIATPMQMNEFVEWLEIKRIGA